jgi:hypothetical protein
MSETTGGMDDPHVVAIKPSARRASRAVGEWVAADGYLLARPSHRRGNETELPGEQVPLSRL